MYFGNINFVIFYVKLTGIIKKMSTCVSEKNIDLIRTVSDQNKISIQKNTLKPSKKLH